MIVFLTYFPKCESFSFVFSSVNANHSHSHSTSQMRIVLIRIYISDPPALPALMCESDNLSSKILREAARVCANPMKIYFYRPGGMCKSDTNMCKSDTASKYSSAQFAAAQRWARVWGSMCKSDRYFWGRDKRG